MADPNQNQQGQKKGQPKQLSLVIKMVIDHNPDDLAKWRENRSVTEEAFNRLAYTKRDEVNSLAKSPKAFALAAQTLKNLVEADQDSGLSADDLSALNSDVFSKTAEAITKAEKKKAEETEKKSKTEQKKKEEEERKQAAGEIHTADQFLIAIPNTKWQETSTERLDALMAAFTEDERKKWVEITAQKGDHKAKFAALVRNEDTTAAVELARANGWI